MNGFGQKYVVDTNTLSQIGWARRASDFFRENVVLPEEVLREAADFPDLGVLRNLVHSTTAQMLEWLVRVMATVPEDDTRLVDLYKNKGGADPMLVACALDGQARDSAYLGAPEWVIVTADQAVRHKAEEFGLKALSNAEFATLIDAANPLPTEGTFEDEGLHSEHSHKTCPKCGSDSMPEPFEKSIVFRIAFVCPEHGVHSTVDPFEGS